MVTFVLVWSVETKIQDYQIAMGPFSTHSYFLIAPNDLWFNACGHARNVCSHLYTLMYTLMYTYARNTAKPINIFQSDYKTSDTPIRLSYHDGNHYNAVVDPLLPTAGLGLGLPGLQPGLADKMQLGKAKAESDQLADQMDLKKVLEESNDDLLQRAIKESTMSAAMVRIFCHYGVCGFVEISCVESWFTGTRQHSRTHGESFVRMAQSFLLLFRSCRFTTAGSSWHRLLQR